MRLNPSLRLDHLGSDLVALDPVGGVVVVLNDEERIVIERIMAASGTGATFDDRQHAILKRLCDAGVVVDDEAMPDGTSRRQVLKLSVAAVAAAGLTAVVLPSAAAASSVPIATGGVITNITVGDVAYRVHTFESSGTFTLNQARNVEYLIVGGGGGGGGTVGGGGGAGQVRSGNLALTPTDYPVTVGAGGDGGPYSIAATFANGGDGGSSSALGFTSVGGGGGGTFTQAGRSGASGGGGGGQGGTAGTATAGFAGGSGSLASEVGPRAVGAGGGGVGGVGGNAIISDLTQTGGGGGSGTTSVITGTTLNYAGGGGGGVNTAGDEPAGGPAPNRSNGVGGAGAAGGGNGGTYDALDLSKQRGGSGAANSGSGGGGGGNPASGDQAGRIGGDGGSGVVILRYPVVEPG